MKRTQKIALAFITAISVGAMAASYATGMGMGPDGGCAMAGMKGKKMANPDQIDSHLAKMKKDLSISTEQEAAWSAFAQTIKQQRTEMVSAMQERMQRAASTQAAKPAPDRVGEHLQFMKQRVAGLEAMASAMNQLYAVLTPKQKEKLDARFGQEMRM